MWLCPVRPIQGAVSPLCFASTGFSFPAATCSPSRNAASPLAFLRQPRDVTVQEGESASFTVKVTGGTWPYAYQWQMYNPKTKKWTDIPGATEATLSREAVEKKWDGARFRCVVTDKAGESITSEAATLTVRESVPTGDKTDLPAYLAVALIALVLLWLLRRRAEKGAHSR